MGIAEWRSVQFRRFKENSKVGSKQTLTSKERLMEIKREKKEKYETPSLESHGSIDAMTQGGAVGSMLDTTFTVGTPLSDLTFS